MLIPYADRFPMQTPYADKLGYAAKVAYLFRSRTHRTAVRRDGHPRRGEWTVGIFYQNSKWPPFDGENNSRMQRCLPNRLRASGCQQIRNVRRRSLAPSFLRIWIRSDDRCRNGGHFGEKCKSIAISPRFDAPCPNVAKSFRI